MSFGTAKFVHHVYMHIKCRTVKHIARGKLVLKNILSVYFSMRLSYVFFSDSKTLVLRVNDPRSSVLYIVKSPYKVLPSWAIYKQTTLCQSKKYTNHWKSTLFFLDLRPTCGILIQTYGSDSLNLKKAILYTQETYLLTILTANGSLSNLPPLLWETQ